MTHGEHAEALAKKLANNHAEFTSFGWSSEEQPSDKQLWAIVYTSNRDSDALERSNESVILRTLNPWVGWHVDGAHVETLSHGHWAVGHVDGILLRVYESDGVTLTPAFLAYSELVDRLDDYLILDEDDYSEREQADAELTWKNCYNDKQRIEYIRDNRTQFEFHSFADMLSCVRGNYFAGYASGLLS